MPVYKLDSVRIAAREGKIEYRSRKVNRDITNLGYELKDVKTCLLSLAEKDFHKSHHYQDGQPSDDAYVINFHKPQNDDSDEVVDRLYVKFRLVDDYLCIDLGSFHV